MKSTSHSIALLIFISLSSVSGCELFKPLKGAAAGTNGSTSPTDPSTTPSDPTSPGATTPPDTDTSGFPVSFEPAIVWDTKYEPILVAVNNLDSEYGLDIATLNAQDNSISTLISKPEAKYAASAEYATGTSPVGWVFGDFDNLNGLDVVSVNEDGNSITLFLNDLNGAFSTSTINTLNKPVAIAAADFDRNGSLDLVVADSGSASIEIFLNDGNGNFAPAPGSPYAVGAKPVALAVGDLNGDSRDDIAVANYDDGTVTILFGDGDGTFDNIVSVTKTVGTGPTALFIADLDDANGADLVVANKGNDSVSVLRNNGTGDFVDAANYFVGKQPTRIYAIDLDDDLFPDIVTLNSFGDSVSVLINDKANEAAGTFREAVNYDTGQNPDSMVIKDINDDENLDIIVTNYSSDNVSVFINDGAGGFGTSQTFAVGDGPKGLAVEDVNADGLVDIVVANSNDNTVSVLKHK